MEASDELNKLLQDLNVESLEKMSDEEVVELRKKLNPYGRTIEGSNKVLTFSYTDLNGQYLKKIITTAMIGYLNRMCDEWEVPTGVPVVPVYDYCRNPELLNDFEKSLKTPNAQLLKEIEFNKKIQPN